MTISKAVEIFLKYIETNSEREFKTESDYIAFDNEFKKYLKSEKKYHEINYKMTLQKKKVTSCLTMMLKL